MNIDEILMEASGLNIRNEVRNAVNSIEIDIPEQFLPSLYNLVFEALKIKYTESTPLFKEHTLSQDASIKSAITDLAKRLNEKFVGKDVDVVVLNWEDSFMFVSNLLQELEFDFKRFNAAEYPEHQDEKREVLVLSYEHTDFVWNYIENMINKHPHDITEVYLVGNNTNRVASAIHLIDDGEVDGYIQGFGKSNMDNRYGESTDLNLMEKYD